MIPFFADKLGDFRGFSTFNARAEGIMFSQMWQGSMKSRRCIIPVDGFYEWKIDEPFYKEPRVSYAANKTAGVTQIRKTTRKQPFAISMKDNEPFAFAGIWDAWKEPKKGSPHGTDHWLQSFTIITTEANELMASIHNRMPVILRPSDYDRWLSREPLEQPPIDLLRPYDSDEMQAVAANTKVGNVKNNGPEMWNSI